MPVALAAAAVVGATVGLAEAAAVGAAAGAGALHAARSPATPNPNVAPADACKKRRRLNEFRNIARMLQIAQTAKHRQFCPMTPPPVSDDVPNPATLRFHARVTTTIAAEADVLDVLDTPWRLPEQQTHRLWQHAAYILNCMKANHHSGTDHDLTACSAAASNRSSCRQSLRRRVWKSAPPPPPPSWACSPRNRQTEHRRGCRMAEPHRSGCRQN